MSNKKAPQGGSGGTESAIQIKQGDHEIATASAKKQKSSKKFVCQEIGTAGEFICTLTTGKLPAALAAGEMSISFKMDDAETYTVSKMSGRKATLSAPSATGSNAYDGKSVPWNFSTSVADGAAQVEEAGDDNTLVGTDDDDFTEDA